MHKLFTTLLLLLCITGANAQKIMLGEAKFKTGDNAEWKNPSFNDADWKTIKTGMAWEKQGYDNYDGYAWYRIHFTMPSALKAKSGLKDSIVVYLAKIDDNDDTYLNGVHIGKGGRFPNEPGGFVTAAGSDRYYTAAVKNLIKWDSDNVIAIRVFDIIGDGGVKEGEPYIKMLDYIDGISINMDSDMKLGPANATNNIVISNKLRVPVSGTIAIKVKDMETNNLVSQVKKPIIVLSRSSKTIPAIAPAKEGLYLEYTFTEKISGKSISQTERVPYILTPKPSPAPHINGAAIVGVRPNSPFLYRIAVSGQKPVHYYVQGLPEGLSADMNTGIITGTLANRGTYKMKVIAVNTIGKAMREFTIKVGDTIALTPPMGWNSWNCWGTSVNAQKVKSSAQAMISKGLVDHGWTYVNIDDAWESPKRADDGSIVPNEKFPDMKGLGDWLHSNGLKFGIYSSPGRVTCGIYTGSLNHEAQDAGSYAGWGIDYLKYDWCSYSEVAGKDTSLEAFQKPYKVMQKALLAQPRDIDFSLCQYGMKDVWKWGTEVGGNSWRTGNDITDSWWSLSDIIERQANLYPYAGPGHWNDPDMLIVGKLGWSGTLHNSKLTPEEQYLHISMWCLLSSPLLIGCDISEMDNFTLNLLTNDEVLAVNQDVLGKQASRVLNDNGTEVWMKELADGSKAVGFFNMSETYKTISVKWSDMHLPANEKVRDLWRQKDLGIIKDTFIHKIPPHGVVFVKVNPAA